MQQEAIEVCTRCLDSVHTTKIDIFTAQEAMNKYSIEKVSCSRLHETYTSAKKNHCRKLLSTLSALYVFTRTRLRANMLEQYLIFPPVRRTEGRNMALHCRPELWLLCYSR